MGTGRARGRQVSLEMTEIWSRNFLFGGFGVLRVTKSFPVIFGQLFVVESLFRANAAR